MVRLIGALSNQDACRHLAAAHRYSSSLRRSQDLGKLEDREPLPLHHAVLKRHALEVLAFSDRPLAPAELRQILAARLNREIRRESVVSLLWAEANDQASSVVRVSRGMYQHGSVQGA